LLVLVGASAGCFAPTPPVGAVCSPSGECPEGQVCGPTNRCERIGTDGGFGGEPDTPPSEPESIDACTSCPTLVAHYAFEGDLASSVMAPAGMMMGDGLEYVAGAIGQGLRIPPSGTAYVHVPDAPVFDLPSGRIELQFRFSPEAPPRDLGLLSRDAVNTETHGHVSLFLGHDRRVVARIQRRSTLSESAYRCTAAPVSSREWHHVALAFGDAGLALYVDGELATGTTWVGANEVIHSCAGPWTSGIDGNDNPLILGALTVYAMEGTGMPVSEVANGVDLDEVMLWAVP
jgi:hypothetical protein